jgi:hypothetical protein
MHELGVAFVRPDSRGFTWLPNRLLPSQAARVHSDKLLARFREICKALEFASMGLLPVPAPAEPAPPHADAAGPEEGTNGEGGAGGIGAGGGGTTGGQSGGGESGSRTGMGVTCAPSHDIPREGAECVDDARGAAGGALAEPRLSTRTLSSSSSDEEKVERAEGTANGAMQP